MSSPFSALFCVFLRVVLLSSRGNSGCSFWRNSQTLSNVASPYWVPASGAQGSRFSTSSPTLFPLWFPLRACVHTQCDFDLWLQLLASVVMHEADTFSHACWLRVCVLCYCYTECLLCLSGAEKGQSVNKSDSVLKLLLELSSIMFVRS